MSLSFHLMLKGDVPLTLRRLGMCLPTGFDTPITYFYFVFLVMLLRSRQGRDDEFCRQKYGDDWDAVSRP